MSPPEYGVALVAVLGIVIVGATLLGQVARHTFDVAGEATHAPDGFARLADAKAGTPVSPSGSSSQASSLWRYEATAGLVVFGCLLFGGALFWAKKHPTRKREEEHIEQVMACTPDLPEAARQSLYRKRQAIRSMMAADIPGLVNLEITVKDVMSTAIGHVPPTAARQEVIDQFREKFCRHMLVRDAAGKLAGIISNRDLAKTGAQTAEQLMTPNPIAIAPETTVNQAITAMIQHHISALPVVREGRILGVVTTTDLLMTLQSTLQVLSSVAKELNVRSAGEVCSEEEPAEVAC